MSIVVFGCVFGAVALLWIVWPLARRGNASGPPQADGVRDDLAERRLLLYQELEEIDLEHEQGDLSADEYAILRAEQKQRVLSLLAERQRQAGVALPAAAPGDTGALSDAIEEEILRIRARRRGGQYDPGDPTALQPQAPAMAGGIHWLWLGVPAFLVLIAFGIIFQLYRSSARTLTEQTPIAQIDAAALVGLAYVTSDHVLMASASGVLQSTDGGRTWGRTELEVAPATLAVSPAGEGFAYVLAAESVHVTADAGRTWQAVPAALPGAEVLAAAVNPFNPAEIYASFAATGLYRSRDAGATWEPVATADEEDIVAVLVSHVPPLLFIALESGRVQVSSDAGETWSAASGAVTMALRGPVRALAGAADGSVIYAAAHTGLYMSTAAGQTWIDLPLRKPLVAVTVDPADARTVLAVTETGEVYRSTDGGIAWRNE